MQKFVYFGNLKQFKFNYRKTIEFKAMEKLLEDNWIDIFNLLSSKDIENAADSCEK